MAGSVSVRTTGLNQVLGRINALSQKLPQAAGDALYRELVGVMVESQKLVPYDEGDLHDSGEVDRPEINGGNISVTLHYGSASVDYALVQHEDPDPPAKPYRHDPPGVRKFLETPLHAWNDVGPERVARKAMGGGR